MPIRKGLPAEGKFGEKFGSIRFENGRAIKPPLENPRIFKVHRDIHANASMSVLAILKVSIVQGSAICPFPVVITDFN
jgi:hypothetical protein